jgi:hypothetical protein
MEGTFVYAGANARVHVGLERRSGPGHVLELVDGRLNQRPLSEWRRYKQHKGVPYVAYALATAISISRVTTGAHFPSDVFIGAATGFAIARFDVLRL